MDVYHLLCNIVQCRNELKSQAWVTLCSHVFCIHHGQQAVDKEKCLICETRFSNKYDIIVMDLNPSEHHKTMILAGLSPEKVLDIAHRSITFWSYQIYQEKLMRESEIKSAKERSAEISDYCESLIAKHKLDIKKIYRELQCYKNQIEQKSKQVEDLFLQVTEKSKQLKKLQSQNESLKRNLAIYMRSDDNYINQQKQYIEQDVIRTCNSNYFDVRIPEHSTSNNDNNNFIFKPLLSSNFSEKSAYEFK